MNSESTPRPCGYDYSTIRDGVIKGNVVPDVLSAQSIATLPVVTATTHVNAATTILSQRDYTIYSDDEDFETDLAELGWTPRGRLTRPVAPKPQPPQPAQPNWN